MWLCRFVSPFVPGNFGPANMAPFEGKKSSNDIIINDTMSDDKVVASHVPSCTCYFDAYEETTVERYFSPLLFFLTEFCLSKSTFRSCWRWVTQRINLGRCMLVRNAMMNSCLTLRLPAWSLTPISNDFKLLINFLQCYIKLILYEILTYLSP